jgi:hypothetical protein
LWEKWLHVIFCVLQAISFFSVLTKTPLCLTWNKHTICFDGVRWFNQNILIRHQNKTCKANNPTYMHYSYKTISYILVNNKNTSFLYNFFLLKFLWCCFIKQQQLFGIKPPTFNDLATIPMHAKQAFQSPFWYAAQRTWYIYLNVYGREDNKGNQEWMLFVETFSTLIIHLFLWIMSFWWCRNIQCWIIIGNSCTNQHHVCLVWFQKILFANSFVRCPQKARLDFLFVMVNFQLYFEIFSLNLDFERTVDI